MTCWTCNCCLKITVFLQVKCKWSSLLLASVWIPLFHLLTLLGFSHSGCHPRSYLAAVRVDSVVMDLCWITVPQLLCTLLIFVGQVDSLSCWQCIADNCEVNPESNYKAERKACRQGQQCQKVFFEMVSDVSTTKYSSLVRSCAEQCVDQDDFLNCTKWMHTSRGCIRRSCCHDQDMCNSAYGSKYTGATVLFWGSIFTASVVLLW